MINSLQRPATPSGAVNDSSPRFQQLNLYRLQHELRQVFVANRNQLKPLVAACQYAVECCLHELASGQVSSFMSSSTNLATSASRALFQRLTEGDLRTHLKAVYQSSSSREAEQAPRAITEFSAWLAEIASSPNQMLPLSTVVASQSLAEVKANLTTHQKWQIIGQLIAQFSQQPVYRMIELSNTRWDGSQAKLIDGRHNMFYYTTLNAGSFLGFFAEAGQEVIRQQQLFGLAMIGYSLFAKDDLVPAGVEFNQSKPAHLELAKSKNPFARLVQAAYLEQVTLQQMIQQLRDGF